MVEWSAAFVTGRRARLAEGKDKVIAMYSLRRTKGETKGDCWPLGAASLFIGRSGQCDITVSDPTVSRRHCEIYSLNGAVHLRDLGSSNLTLVNGQPVKTAELHPGSRITVGTAHFVLEEGEPGEAAEAEDPMDAGRRSLAVERSMYLDEARLNEVKAQGAEGVDALSRLFRLSRLLSETQTIPEIAMVLHEIVNDTFKPAQAWLARCIEERSSLTFFNGRGEVVDAPEDAPRKIIEAAFFRRSGLLWPVQQEEGLASLVAAPLVVPEKRVGIVVLQSPPGELFTSTDMELLCAIAHTAAPFVKSTEQVEQTQLSLTKLRKQWGL
jgi:pSer/pThr/pTyr-binding forkhead associated (FHA) protein